MNTEWSLNELYTGFEDPSYEKDFEKLKQAIDKQKLLADEASGEVTAEQIGALLTNLELIQSLSYNLSAYLELRQSVNTEDGSIMAQSNRLLTLMSSGEETASAVQKIFARIPDVDAMAKASPVVSQYAYLLKRAKEQASHFLSDEVEAMVSAMNMTGGNSWGQLQAYLTSTVKVPYGDEVLTLSEVRNLAYSPDKEVRKSAYEAELAAYDQIAGPIAFSLNNIKSQVNMLCKKRGYASALELTLEQSDMKKETLDAMFTAIKEALPVFGKYLRHKAKLLGYKNGLPWYELYAELGSSDKTYSLEETRDYLCRCFEGFTPDMVQMIEQAFAQSWIDFYPRSGKCGGAFCCSVPSIHQSRILTNFDGYFGSIRTLAHELGHAYHNTCLDPMGFLVQDSPMQVAETASTFNEVLLGNYALAGADDKERLSLLDSDLREQTQCIVDIYSRFLFESAVFEQTEDKFLMPEDLKKLMLTAQREAFGNGLDPETLHPYMWVCKSHYYSSGLSFYNFPYAFGNLFAQGLYALYQEQGASFVPKYKEMLASTGCKSIEQIGAMMGIDLTRPDFWRQSLAQIAAEVEEFCRY